MPGYSVGTSVFVLGKEDRKNREVLSYSDGEYYSVDISTLTSYTVETTRFPYQNPL